MREDYTAIAMIIDRSGSMIDVVDDTIGGVNSFIENQRNQEGDASILMVQFDDKIETIHDFVDIKDVDKLTNKVYFPRGSTALLDSLGSTINRLGNILSDMDEEKRPSKVIVAVLTDGQENSSNEYTASKIKSMIEHQEGVYNWDFNFISADINALSDAQEWGFSSGKSAQYSKSSTSGTFGALSNKISRVRSASMDEYLSCSVQDFSVSELKSMIKD